jgi:hypothetical protein
MAPQSKDDLTKAEIQHRMEAGIRRALSTPPTPTKELVGKTERAQEQAKSRARKAARSKAKDA